MLQWCRYRKPGAQKTCCLRQLFAPLAGALLWCASVTAVAEERQELLYSQKEFRYQYYHALLRQALNATEGDYGRADIGAYQGDIAETTDARCLILLQQKRIHVVFLPTNRERETSFRAVPIPLDQGLQGLRLLLIKEASQARFDRIQDEVGLREKMLGGFNPHWSDFHLYKSNGFSVVPATKYETLFKMLNSGRFDYFSRGLIEVWAELENFKSQYPDLRVETRFAFYYDYPVYFFVHKDNEQLAQRIEMGLKRIQASGAFSNLFQAYYGEHIARAKLKQRNIIILQNPEEPEGVPMVKPFWWPASVAFPDRAIND